MASTVFANDSGLFHKGSGGYGAAFPDVCLSPPPPPTGPAPIPYPNNLNASDLVSGSRTVKIEGEPTALEDSSYISTSTGDEGGTQGGNIVTHKTKGKGYFQLWSFDVQIEDKGVDRHGDPLGQNCASSPLGAMDIQAIVNKAYADAKDPKKPCVAKYDSKKDRPSIVKAQREKVAAGPCWQCGSTSPLGNDQNGTPIPYTSETFTPDHVPPIVAYWYAGGCHKTADERKADLQSPDAVQPHCSQCSDSQGGETSGYSQTLSSIHEAMSIAKMFGL